MSCCSALLSLLDQPRTEYAKQDVLQSSWLVTRQQASPGVLLWVQPPLPLSLLATQLSVHVKRPAQLCYLRRHYEVWGHHTTLSAQRRRRFQIGLKLDLIKFGTFKITLIFDVSIANGYSEAVSACWVSLFLIAYWFRMIRFE